MRSRRIAGAIVAVALMSVGGMAQPAAAAAHLEFTCDGEFPLWASVGLPGGDCVGSVTGAVLPSGPVCIPVCAYWMTVEEYETPCLLGFPPHLATFRGRMVINGQWVANYEATAAGMGTYEVAMTVDPLGSAPPDTGAGQATLVLSAPFGTCIDPHRQRYEMVGQLWWT